MKVFSLGLAICAALAVTSELTEAKGATICETGSGFADTGDNYSSETPAVSASAGSDATQTTGSDGGDVNQVGVSSSTAGSGSTRSVAGSILTNSYDTPVTSLTGSDGTTTSQTDDSTTQGDDDSTPTKGGTNSAEAGSSDNDINVGDDSTSAGSDSSSSASTEGGAGSTKQDTNDGNSSVDAADSVDSAPRDVAHNGSDVAGSSSETGQQDVVDASVNASKTSSGSTSGQNSQVDSGVGSKALTPTRTSPVSSASGSSPVQTTTSSSSDTTTTQSSTDRSTSSSDSVPAQTPNTGSTDTVPTQSSTSASKDTTPTQTSTAGSSSSTNTTPTQSPTEASASAGSAPTQTSTAGSSSSTNTTPTQSPTEASASAGSGPTQTSTAGSSSSTDTTPIQHTSSDASASAGSAPTQTSTAGSSSSTNTTPTQSPTDASASAGSAPTQPSTDTTPIQHTSTTGSTSSTNSNPTQSSVSSSGSSNDSPAQASASGSSGDSTPSQSFASASSASSTPTPTSASASTSSDASTASSTSTASSALASASSSSSRSSSSSSSSSPFTKVTHLGVRVQGDMPEWNEEHQRFVSSYYDTFDEKYRAVMDTVNMASVEGALKYVQAECINASVITDCERKNNIKYVVFYQTTVAQPTAAMDYYVNATNEYDFAVEHCPFMAMDGGQCDPNSDGSFPDVCNQYIGAAGQPDLGFCVGGTLQDNEAIAPYPHNYWFSFPNSCPQELWDDKTDSCREKYAGGMCPVGVEPDGVTCTFSYEILGYILLDDVVGITSMVNPLTGKKYADYYEFCKAGGIEFSISFVTSVTSLLSNILGSVVSLVEGLDFWSNPGDSDANAARVEKLVSAYDLLVSTNATTSDGGLMRVLPTVDELSALNPPCYQNSPLCAESEFGCKRSYRSQICQVCTSHDSGCEKQQ